MGFIDQANIKVIAGKGGNGMTSFRREKGVSKGGPDGGNGGKGGDIYLTGSANTDGLAKFRHIRKYQADSGKDGYRSRSSGKSGEDLYLEVPLGTVVYLEDKVLGEILAEGDRLLVAKGGRGGLGNAHFKSNRLKAPDFSETGLPGEHFDLELELKLIADVGLVGFPNVGKSTLLNKLSGTKAKVGNYAFTTLFPGLGVIKTSEDKIIIADLPGIIAEAHQGKGLGLQFLKHIERTKLKVFIIDFFNDLNQDYQTLVNELNQYSSKILSSDNYLIAINKIDGISKEEVNSKITNFIKTNNLSNKLVLAISAATGENLDLLIAKIIEKIAEAKLFVLENQDTEILEINLANLDDIWQLQFIDNSLELSGKDIEDLVLRQNLTNWNNLNRLYRIFTKKGIIKKAQKFIDNKYPIINCRGRLIDFTVIKNS